MCSGDFKHQLSCIFCNCFLPKAKNVLYFTDSILALLPVTHTGKLFKSFNVEIKIKSMPRVVNIPGLIELQQIDSKNWLKSEILGRRKIYLVLANVKSAAIAFKINKRYNGFQIASK